MNFAKMRVSFIISHLFCLQLALRSVMGNAELGGEERAGLKAKTRTCKRQDRNRQLIYIIQHIREQ